MTRNAPGRIARVITPLTLALVAGQSVCAQEVKVVRPVAELLGPATGVAGKMIFEDFGVHPEVEQHFGISNVAVATIDEDGNVGFHAFYGDDGVPNLPGETAPSAMFRTRNGQIEVLTLTDGPAPGTGMKFGGPGIIPDTPDLGGGVASFVLQIGGGPFDFEPSIWSDQSGMLGLVAAHGQRLPGMPSGSGVEALSSGMVGKMIVFTGRIVGGPSPDILPSGLWRNRGDLNEVILATDLAAPGLPGAVFGESTSTQRGPLRFFDFHDNQEIAFIGNFKGQGIGAANDEGIWVESGGDLKLRLREGDSVPPGLFAGEPVFRMLSSVDRSVAGAVAFTSQVDKLDGTARVPTLWTDRNGSLELIVRGQRRFVFGNVPGDLAPGTNTTFLGAGGQQITDDGVIFFQGSVDVSPDPFNPQQVGIWMDDGSGLELVVIEGGDVPGMPGVSFTGPLNADRGVGPFELEDDGSLVYLGRFRDERSEVRLGVFRRDVDGEQVLLVHEGQTVGLDGSSRRLTIETIEIRLDSGTSLAGEKVAHITFTDRTAGIYTFPALESACYADCDASTGAGVLDLFDFLCFQGSFVAGDPYACECDTSTGPLVCDLFDFLCFQDSFVGGCS